MKTLSWWPIGSGIVFFILTFIAPIIMRWQAERSLAGIFGAQELVPDMMEVAMEELRLPILLTRVNSILSVVAGVLMLRRMRSGWILWVVLCVAALLGSALDILTGSAILVGFLRAALWGVVLRVSWITVQEKAATYWRATN